MEHLLFLTHRIPYPPNKGDKIRSYHLLKHLAQRYRVHLGTFIDDPADWTYVDNVKQLCGETCFASLNPPTARLRSLAALTRNRALTVDFYRDAGLRSWVAKMTKEQPIQHTLVFSSAMAQYAPDTVQGRRIIDFVDIDSDKWAQYADKKYWPMRWLYRREARHLLRYERQIADEFDASLFVSEAEAALFKQLAPENAGKIGFFSNGVDTDYFSPAPAFDNPYSADEQVLVFTGAMDYWPNIDAVQWFAGEILPTVRARHPGASFYIVGSRPTPQVQALESVPGVHVTGTVPDVRPYVAHARIAVAPLRIARGIQNKVLEAMAMAKPVVVSPQALEGIDAEPGLELLRADNAEQFVSAVTNLLDRPNEAMGRLARRKVETAYGWASNLARVDALFPTDERRAEEARAPCSSPIAERRSLIAMRNDSSNLPVVALLAIALLAPLLIYFDTARSIVSIWNSSETFAHGYIILPISLWLIWKRREVFAHQPVNPFWPALLLLGACGFAWLLADLANVQVVRQYALVAMIPIAVIALVGVRLSGSLAFPLLFLMLAVPFGEIFIRPLIDFTADFTVAALRATGIPVLRDGANFSIPSGDWSVVEACSGVRYLIASFTLGCLYAYLTYRSRVRQAIFVILSIVIPIIANGIRAYMIVMIGHLSGMEHAVGADHLIYGWVFFGLVMFLMYWIGSFWRDDQQEPQDQRPVVEEVRSDPPTVQATPTRVLTIALSVVICMAVWPGFAKHIERSGFNPAPAELARFQGRWQEAAPFTSWKPSFFPANAELSRYFERDGKKAGITVLYYRNQNRGSGLISSENRLVQSLDPMWRTGGTMATRETISNRSIVLRETRIQGASGPLLVWHWYWIDGRRLTNDYIGKLLQAKEKVLMKGDDGAAIFAFAPYVENPDEARKVLRDFLAEHLGPLELTLSENTRNGTGKRDD